MMRSIFIALAVSLGASVASAQTLPTPAGNSASSPFTHFTAPDGRTITIVQPLNSGPPARPANAVGGGIFNMPPNNQFWINYAAVMKPLAGFNSIRITTNTDQGTGIAPQPTDGADFRIGCTTSHMLRDDPIVGPGRPGTKHLHTFFGNSDVNGSLNSQTLGNLAQFGRSSCAGGTANRSGYWVPSLINTVNGYPLVPTYNNVYYKSGSAYRSANPTLVKAPPPGLRMIAGESGRTTPRGGDGGITRWACNPPGDNIPHTSVQADYVDHIYTAGELAAHPNWCNDGDDLMMQVFFPQCWDGKNLDSPGHQAHMAYQDFYAGCPAGFPVLIPEISYNIHYDIKAAGGRGNIPNLRLASDAYSTSLPGGYSSHGDWINGWNQVVMETLVQNCLHTHTDCHDGVLDAHGTSPYRLMY